MKQKTIVIDYQARFEELRNMVRGWPSEAMVRASVGGLKEKHRIEVQAVRT